jgi:hypothetical protein
MLNTKRALFAATLALTIGFAGSALAQGKKNQAPGQTEDIPGKFEAPGQTGDNPGQTIKTERGDDRDITSAVPPGQQNSEDPNAFPPGESVKNFGKLKKGEVPD